jgi:hypothetical protein
MRRTAQWNNVFYCTALSVKRIVCTSPGHERITVMHTTSVRCLRLRQARSAFNANHTASSASQDTGLHSTLESRVQCCAVQYCAVLSYCAASCSAMRQALGQAASVE